jgi:hypothetical protein
MGVNNSKITIEPFEYFFIERIIDSEKMIYIGVLQSKNSIIENSFENQGIRIGNESIKRLKKFEENNNMLYYLFEDNIELQLIKNSDHISLRLKSKNINYIKKIDKIIEKIWKPINFNSFELDHITNLIDS